MGKLFKAVMPDGSERFAADMANGRAALFYDLAVLLEGYAGVPCGIAPDAGRDEHLIDPAAFLAFFERLWAERWVLEVGHGFLAGWAGHAAGMLENITLRPRRWVDRRSDELAVTRYQRPDEVSTVVTRTPPAEHSAAPPPADQ